MEQILILQSLLRKILFLISFSQFEFTNLFCFKWRNKFNCNYKQVSKALIQVDPAQI
jgi:hypothetical protein